MSKKNQGSAKSNSSEGAKPPSVSETAPTVPTIELADRPLHCVGVVCKREGVSKNALAAALGVPIEVASLLMDECSDLSVSQLVKIGERLNVPVSELLLEEGDDALSSPVRRKAGLTRVMKTALSILEGTKQPPIRRYAETLIEQLLEMMPELEQTAPWPSVGKLRERRELGVIAERVEHEPEGICDER